MPKQKVLLISLYKCFPYPLDQGGAIAQYFFIDGLKHEVEFMICTQVNHPSEYENIRLFQEKQPDIKVFYVNRIQEHPKFKKNIVMFLSGLERKAKKIIKSLIIGKKPVLNKIDTDNFSAENFWKHTMIDSAFDAGLIELIHQVIVAEDIKTVQFDFYESLNLVFLIPANVRKIFVHHELRFKRLKLAYHQSNMPPTYKDFIINKVESYEKFCLQKMDRVIVFNDDDAELLKHDCKDLVVSPFGIPDELIYKKNVCSVFSRFLFVGGESHLPNLLGLSWFLDEIFIPNLNRIDLPIYIVGNWSKEVINNYSVYSQIVFCGMVESIEPHFENSIFLNPILTGSGIRTKILHAFANKVPVISTRFGAEGCFSEDEKYHLILFDTASEFIAEIHAFHNEHLRQVALNGFSYYNKRFDKEELLKKRLDVYHRH